MSYGGDNVIPSTAFISDDTSLAASFESSPYEMHKVKNLSFVLKCTNVTDNTGVFSFQVANSLPSGEAPPASGDWVSLTLSSVPTLANADSNFAVALGSADAPIGMFQWVRFTFSAAGVTPDGVLNIDVKRVAQGR